MRCGSIVTGAICLMLTFGLDAAGAATCSRRPLSQTQSVVESFKFRPAGLLDRFANGETLLSQILASVVSADPDGTLDKALDLLKTANVYQRRAIGTGLGLAAQLCQQNGQSETARRMSEALRKRIDRDATMAFTAVSMQNVVPPPLPTRKEDTGPSRLLGRSSTPETRIFESQPLNDPLRPITPLQ